MCAGRRKVPPGRRPQWRSAPAAQMLELRPAWAVTPRARLRAAKVGSAPAEAPPPPLPEGPGWRQPAGAVRAQPWTAGEVGLEGPVRRLPRAACCRASSREASFFPAESSAARAAPARTIAAHPSAAASMPYLTLSPSKFDRDVVILRCRLPGLFLRPLGLPSEHARRRRQFRL